MTTEPSDLVERLRCYVKVGTACGNLTDNPRNITNMANQAADELTRLRTQVDAMTGALDAVRAVREGYVSQMKFCDIEAMGYFREFVRRIDQALSTHRKTNDV